MTAAGIVSGAASCGCGSRCGFVPGAVRVLLMLVSSAVFVDVSWIVSPVPGGGLRTIVGLRRSCLVAAVTGGGGPGGRCPRLGGEVATARPEGDRDGYGEPHEQPAARCTRSGLVGAGVPVIDVDCRLGDVCLVW